MFKPIGPFDMNSVFEATVDEIGSQSKARKEKVTFEDPSAFLGLEELVQNLACRELARDSLKRVAEIVCGKSIPDPTVLMNNSDLFGNVTRIMQERDEATLSDCLAILGLLTHADFKNGCPFLDGDLLGWITECLKHPDKLTRQRACLILSNLFADGIVGVDVMRRCVDFGVLNVLYEMCSGNVDMGVALELLSYFIHLTEQVFPEQLQIFVPFIPMMLQEVAKLTKLATLAVDCLSSLCFHEQCLEHMMRRPDISLASIIRNAIFQSSLTDISNLFTIVNCIIERDNECTAFSDEQFVRHVGMLLGLMDPDETKPLLVFIDGMVEGNWNTLMVSGVPDVVLGVLQRGSYRHRIRVGFLLAHMIRQSLDKARYPEWVNSSVTTLLELLDGLSERKCQVTLGVLLDCVERNPQHFIPLLHSANAELYLTQLIDDVSSPEIHDVVRLLISAITRDGTTL